MLAGEGLSLGRFDLGDQQRQGQAPAREPGDEPTARPGAPRAGTSSSNNDQPVRTVDGRIHVTA